ncbi:acetoacetate--CoA ligase [Rhodococcus sp. WS4]|nr:acetoacetate--CoA ligase [Rhodococcus sp. WS4]
MTRDTEALWTPSAEDVRDANITTFARQVSEHHGSALTEYADLWQWSVDHLDEFWREIWDYSGLGMFGSPRKILAIDKMPGARWLSGTPVNFAEYTLVQGEPGDIAITDITEQGPARTTTHQQLRNQVSSLAAHLRAAGVGKYDVVAGYVPNSSEAVIAMLATTAIGAIWSSVGQDYAAAAAIDRLGQLSPKVLIGATGYRFGGRVHSRTAELDAIAQAIPSLTHVICIERQNIAAPSAWVDWNDVTANPQPLECERVTSEHPLWILFSSGTTGRPKGIVHGHGGILLESVKQLSLHWDLKPGDRLFWFTSPSWVMWNLQASALAVGAGIVCYDGSPTNPDTRRLWKIVDESNVTFFGTSPGFLQSSLREGVDPAREFALASLRAIGSTGSPLPPDVHRWAHQHIKGVPLWSLSGGTDVAGAFFAGTPTMPIWPGELSVRCLGVAAYAWDDRKNAVVDQVGELVVTRPMPSMPVSFWNDPTGERERDAYFSTFDGLWRHGDWISVSAVGSVTVHGRSDSTLNRHGVRMGSADIYAAVDGLSGVVDSMVIGAEMPDGNYWMPLFVQLAPDVELDDELVKTINDAIRSQASPRHVPDEIIAVTGIPHTRTGKKLEVPVKRLIQGADLADVVNPDAVDDPGLIAQYVQAARRNFAQSSANKVV